MALFAKNSEKVIQRRTVLLAILMSIPFPILMSRLYYLQNFLGSKYRRLAEKNRIRIRPLRPERGKFFDRYGQILGQDVPSPRLVMVREQCPDPEKVLARLSRLIQMSNASIANTLKEIYRRAPFTPVTVTKSIDFKELAKVEVNQPDLPGIDFVSVPVRTYTRGETIGHLVGYVGRTDDYKIDKAGVEGWAPDFPVGRQGLEKLYENRLDGQPGFSHMEANAVGRSVQELERFEPKKGEDIQLTLDANLQSYAYDRLENEVGAAVVMDIKSGAVLSAVSRPGFNPDDFSEGIAVSQWKILLNDEDNPLLNRTLQGAYSPGSTFKPVVALAALEEGVVDTEEEINCVGKMRLGRREFHCWKKHGKVDLDHSIAGSCDIFYYEMGKRLGIRKMAKYAEMMGLGKASAIGLPEKEGIVPTPEWKKKARNEAWAQGEDLITAIGQGFLLTTPLQMAQMCARLASGKEVTASLLVENEKKDFKKLPVKEENLKIVREGMFHVINAWYGTAKSAKRKGFEMAGKTGTVQVVSRRIEEGVHMDDVPLKERPHGIFIGFAPYDNPRYAVAVVVENGGSGSGAAAPVAADIMAEAMKGWS